MNAEDYRMIRVILNSEVELFLLHAPRSNFHRNEQGPASNAVSSSLYTFIDTMLPFQLALIALFVLLHWSHLIN